MKKIIKRFLLWMLGFLIIGVVVIYAQLCYTRAVNYDPIVQISCIHVEPIIVSWACEYSLRHYTFTPAVAKEINSKGGAYFALSTESGDLEKSENLLRFFLQKGVDINATASLSHSTSLHTILMTDHALPYVELLLKYGARVDIRDKWGRTPLELAYFLNQRFPAVDERKEIIRILKTAELKKPKP
jgi:hypothetical protein